ncbi:uncharacterized protein LACBIDRAFT_332559 [Laccaria bicolor S238N-H82]|uniref:Predicted protein n=1 Tax=Laccaria bicolor (strain S238N-H82 / ATCC MYA-4686) TaxID=486041 RepID=B0DT47_LACBS|nr:uncharacterized protein LACBIDRAFT_332559 [Laccaria bicolor S238N-H82]EDR02157.1 predicted protein [Laccaria bicolor S238N-H82]|eukprot:XP_001887102.1 predicted protein [Laccaria bicolor S238N-H82]
MAVLAEWDEAGLALKPKEARFWERREATTFLSREKAWIEQWLNAWKELDEHQASTTDYYNTDQYFNHPLRKANPALIITMFIAVALSVIANVSRSPCNLVLHLMKHMLQLVAPSVTWENIPEDICTAHQKFDLDPVTTTYATCPACSFLYAPVEKDGHQVYPP